MRVKSCESPDTSVCPSVPTVSSVGLATRNSQLATVRRAFSLVEIMVVVVIIGLIAGLATYSVSVYLDKAKVKTARADISTLAGAVDSYYLEKSRYPTTQEGLQAVVSYLQKKAIPNDPWGRPFQYVQPGRNAAYDIVSYGADGREGGSGTDADLTNNDVETGKTK